MADYDEELNLYRDGAEPCHEPEFTFELLDYARSHFTSITVPMFDLTLENRELFYWTCFTLNELSRRTGDRIEFILHQDGNDVYLKTYSFCDAQSNPYIIKIVQAVEERDISLLKGDILLPKSFRMRSDPLSEKEERLARLAAELEQELGWTGEETEDETFDLSDLDYRQVLADILERR